MQVSEMAATHLLRSHISLLNSSKFKLLRPSVNSLTNYCQHNLNPNFSLHFRPIHSITPKSFPESPLIDVNGASKEPTSEPTPRLWSTFSSPQFRPIHSITPKSFPDSPLIDVNGASEELTSEPTHRFWSTFSSPPSSPANSINCAASSGEEESRNRVNLSSNVINGNGASEKPTSEPTPRVCSTFSSPPSSPANSIKCAASSWEEESRNRVNLSNVIEPTSQPTRVWSTFSSPPSSSANSINGVASSGEEESRNRVNLSSNVIEPTTEPTPRVSSTFSSPPSSPANSINDATSSGEEENRVNLSSNVIDGNDASEEPTSEPTPRVWSAFSSPPSSPENSINGAASSGEEEASSGEEESINRVNLSSNVAKSAFLRNPAGRGKKGKSKMCWVCADCGSSTSQWWGICKSCNKVGTLKRFSVSEDDASDNVMSRSWLPEQMVGQNAPVRLMDVNRGINHLEWRMRLSGLLGLEVNRVLGGGVVPGSLILVGGDPGVGKSTLALQVAALAAVSPDVGGAAPVLYISGEESVEQIGNRADRLSIITEDLYLYSSTDIEDILEKVQVLSPRVVIIDSIQTMYLKGVTGSPGGMTQVEECTATLLRFAKKTNIPVLLIGHVNKNGDIAGPRVLEHIVDVVLYMEGDKNSSHRLLRSVKNRFGSTDELGVFAMSETGLEAVLNPSEMFLSEEYSDSDHLAGLAITVIIDGSRSFLVEVQALCVSGPGCTRHVNGVQLNRAHMIISVLKKQAGLKLDDHSIFLNVISGVDLAGTSGDLAVALAICSSFLEFPLPNSVAFIGEIGLGGELRTVPRIEKRVTTLEKLGYKKCIVPESARKALSAISSEIEIVGCKNLKQVIDKVFRRQD